MTGSKPSAVLLTTGLSSGCGGPFFSVSGLAAAVAKSGLCDAAVVGTYSQSATWADDRRQWAGTKVSAMPGNGLASAQSLVDRTQHAFKTTERLQGHGIVHVSGLWDAASLAGAILQARGFTCMVSPRGMLEPWALSQKAAKKGFAMMLWQRRLLAQAVLLHATAESELQSIRNIGLRTPVCIVPNGVEFPPDDLYGSLAGIPRGEGRRIRTAVFLSRIHPKKGLPLLIEAWSRVRPSGWALVIAGYSEDVAHEAEMRQLVQTLRLDSVSFVGERTGIAKWDFLRSADLFVLPSHSENFGIVVAEAMVVGLPVIATTGAPWRILRDEGMGWWTEPTVEGIAAALTNACSEADEQRAKRGAKARAYAAREFSWDGIGRRMARCYLWAAGLGPITDDIVFA